jgi:phenylacetate-coenzyme A ligase PaaK-like adenylate-forming protein
MSNLADVERSIDSLLKAPLYGMDPSQRQGALLALLKQQIACACDRNPRYRNYTEHWPIDFRSARAIADLPYLPASVFKANPPLALVATSAIRRTLTSSATRGQIPSRVALDASTARRMTRGIITIVRNFIGSTRRPYLVIDVPENLLAQAELGARGVAIQGLTSFATEVVSCLRVDETGNLDVDLEKLFGCAEKWKKTEVLVYGFTSVIWSTLVKPLQREGVTLRMSNVQVLHSGGWKRLEEQAVKKDEFARGVAQVFGCTTDRVIDCYGMVENVGVIYPDCEHGNKHVPAFADVIIRDALTLAPVEVGQQGLVQVCSVLPTSFPGFLVLTDDMGQITGYDGCSCGRRGTHFRFASRVPKSETRGCGNLETTRYPAGHESKVA